MNLCERRRIRVERCHAKRARIRSSRHFREGGVGGGGKTVRPVNERSSADAALVVDCDGKSGVIQKLQAEHN
jgi:hypothetical protein